MQVGRVQALSSSYCDHMAPMVRDEVTDERKIAMVRLLADCSAAWRPLPVHLQGSSGLSYKIKKYRKRDLALL